MPVDLVNRFVENSVGINGALDGGNADTSFFDDDTAPMPLPDGIASVGTVDVGQDGARAGDNDIVDDGHLNNGIVGEYEGDDGNNKDDGFVGDGADTNEILTIRCSWIILDRMGNHAFLRFH
ncbi:hypothetical protein NC651_004690 [Populus alba x Populus x berolinensis]|nr:hypothetical protein NC651_004690 [Populus alba x Populus x berolinensis]